MRGGGCYHLLSNLIWRKGTYGHAEFLRQGVDFCVFQQLRAAVVDLRRRGIGFEGSAGELVREVFARVEVFEHAGDGV